MGKWTPGPWRLGKLGKHSQHIDGGAGSSEWWSLAKVVVKVEGEPCAVGEANARLIAAAPELLEALCGLLEVADFISEHVPGAGWRMAQHKARAAIVKATGETP